MEAILLATTQLSLLALVFEPSVAPDAADSIFLVARVLPTVASTVPRSSSPWPSCSSSCNCILAVQNLSISRIMLSWSYTFVYAALLLAQIVWFLQDGRSAAGGPLPPTGHAGQAAVTTAAAHETNAPQSMASGTSGMPGGRGPATSVASLLTRMRTEEAMDGASANDLMPGLLRVQVTCHCLHLR